MRISLETAQSWAAVSQRLADRAAVDSEEGDGAAPAPEQTPLATGQPNHVPFISLMARQGDPAALQQDQQQTTAGAKAQWARVAGLRTGTALARVEILPAMARLAAVRGRAEAERLIAPLDEDEIRESVSWIQSRLSARGETYPELREQAPDDLLRPVQRGSERALYQETVIQQVLLALEVRGDLVTTLDGGLNTSEGPYRYQLRSSLCPGPLPSSEEAFAVLADWYFRTMAPAGVRDFVAWSGLPEPVARRALRTVVTPLKSVAVDGTADDLLAPESLLDQPALDPPVCVVIPWLDQWLHAYRDQDRFAPDGIPGSLAPRDVVLVSVGRDIPAAQSLAARIRVVGSAREPRFQPEPWRPLASFEQAALAAALERLSVLFNS